MADGGTKKQKIILGVLAAILAVALVNNLFLKGGVKDAGDSGGNGTFNLGKLPPANMPLVRVELLESLNVPVEVSRNIFDPVYRPPVVKPVITPKPATTPPAGIGIPNPNYVPPPPPKPREQLEAERARDDLGKFRFVGFILRRDVLDIFLAKDTDYYVARPGETITEGYYIKEVKPDSITIADRRHKIDGKEIEVSIKADFEGEDADVITGTSAPFVGVGAIGGSVGGGSAGGGSPIPQQQQRTRPRPRGPAGGGGRRAPAAPPRGVSGVLVNTGGGAATPEPETEAEPSPPEPFADHSIP